MILRAKKIDGPRALEIGDGMADGAEKIVAAVAGN